MFVNYLFLRNVPYFIRVFVIKFSLSSRFSLSLFGTVRKVSDFRVFRHILGRFLVDILSFCRRLKFILNQL